MIEPLRLGCDGTEVLTTWVPGPVIWVLWESASQDHDPKWSGLVSIHSSEASASEYAAKLQRLEPERRYIVTEEWLLP